MFDCVSGRRSRPVLPRQSARATFEFQFCECDSASELLCRYVLLCTHLRDPVPHFRRHFFLVCVCVCVCVCVRVGFDLNLDFEMKFFLF